MSALGFARRAGAERAINVASEPDALIAYGADKGAFDAMFEASGAEAALRGGFEAVRPGGVIVQLGLGGDMTLYRMSPDLDEFYAGSHSYHAFLRWRP